jgi:BolA protein
MSVAARIRERLAALEPLDLELVDESAKHAGHAGSRPGGGTHWRLSIVSPRFAGQTTLARHRMVYQALGELMHNPIHALAITARAPEEMTKGSS